MGELITGTQTGRIVSAYLSVDDKQQTYVNIKWEFEGVEKHYYTRVYITPRSAGIARQALKKCGLDINKEGALGMLDDDPNLLAGNEVLVDVVQNGNYLNVVIPTERERVPKAKLSEADKLLKTAKKGDDAGDDGPPPDDIPF